MYSCFVGSCLVNDASIRSPFTQTAANTSVSTAKTKRIVLR